MTRPRSRPRFTRFSALMAFLLTAGLVAFAAQPPEVEDPKAKAPTKKVGVEEEDSKGTIKKKVVVDDPAKPGPVAPAGNAPDVKLDELVLEAGLAKHPALRDLLTRFSVPFDRMTDSRGSTARIKPVTLWHTDPLPKDFPVTELQADGSAKEPRAIGPGDLKRFDYFEELAILEADLLLKQKPLGTSPGPDGMAAEDQLATAEKLLAAVLRFHDFARERKLRPGKKWDEVRKPLADRLRDVRVLQLERAVTASDWYKAREFGTKLMAGYPQDAAVAQVVAKARVAEAAVLLKSKDHPDHVRARELLDEYLARFPTGNDQIRKLRSQLTAEAVRLYERARQLKADGNLVEARNDLARASDLDPAIPGLRDMQRELDAGFGVLYVGVRRFPELMSPALARYDSEKQAVELLFEGLLEEIPDARGGVRYRTGATLSLPLVVPGGRELILRQFGGEGGGPGFDAHDVVETVRFLRTRPELWAAAGLPWFEDLPAPRSGGELRIGFKHGHPDPRALLTFKLLQGRLLAQRGLKVDNDQFAREPFGTGPYKLYSLPKGAGGNAARELVFVDNPAYGRWKDRVGLPHIREIRLVEVPKLADPFNEFRAGRLHLLPDLTPEEMAKFFAQVNELSGKGKVVASSNARRVHILAVNHRRPPFQNKDLRQGLSGAIDREGVLLELTRNLRPELRQLTAAMSGPFPPASWATWKGPAGVPVPLLNRGNALVKLRNYLAIPGAKAEFDLAYAADDPQAALACNQIKAQIEGMFKDVPADGLRLTIKLQPLPPDRLFITVNEEARFDLAYLPFDYPDDWYPYGLAAFLDPTAAGRGGRNYTGYGAENTNADRDDRDLNTKLQSLRQHRDYSGEIVKRATEIHKSFNDTLPFIPLWQLDRHMLVHNNLELFVDEIAEPTPAQALNPTTLFQGVARWRLKREVR